jgi:hypothetical protein
MSTKEIVLDILNHKVKVKLNPNHASKIVSDYTQWKESPTERLLLGLYSDNKEHVCSIDESQSVEYLQGAVWKAKEAFEDAEKYHELLKNINKVKSIFEDHLK